MGFLGALGNILAGKPIYGDEASAAKRPDGHGDGAAPVVRVIRVESPIKGDRLEVNITLRNESSVLVFVDKIHLLGTTHEIDNNLPPGMSREYAVYAGPVLHNDSHRDAELQYRTQDGEYFVARNQVRYYKENDGLHIGELRLVGEVSKEG